MSALETYYAKVFENVALPDDLRAILKSDAVLKTLLTHGYTKLLGSEDTHSLISHDYLNERDRANNDTMCNVTAMNDTAQKLIFIAIQEEGVVGYWLGDMATSSGPYLYMLDTEGQYRICEGKGLVETICYQALLYDDHDRFKLLQASFMNIGIAVEEKSKDQIFGGMDKRQKETKLSPQKFRSQRYEFYKENGL